MISFQQERNNGPDARIDAETIAAVEKAASCYAAKRKETAQIYSRTENLVEFRYWNYIGRRETAMTAEDIRQEVLIVLMQDEKRPKPEFLNRYISQRIKDIDRKRRAKKRSLPIDYFEGGIYDKKNRPVSIEAILEDKIDGKTRNLKRDVRRAVKELKGEMRKFCELIMDDVNDSAIKWTLKITDLKMRMLKKEIRGYFQACQLHRYLRHSSYCREEQEYLRANSGKFI